MNRAAPEPKANMGQPEPRLDGRLKVTGEARYGSDFPVSNPAFAYLIISPIAKGRIQTIDLADAKAVPGVIQIFTHENMNDIRLLKFSTSGGGPISSWQKMGPEIGHDGQIIGMVVAENFETARCQPVESLPKRQEAKLCMVAPSLRVQESAKRVGALVFYDPTPLPLPG
jgi:xanthine dehydrogenase YagR molybdenum-binding subunit